MSCFVIGKVVFQHFEVSQCLHLQGQAAQEEFQVPEPKDEGTVDIRNYWPNKHCHIIELLNLQ
jgi:hypothetical protein